MVLSIISPLLVVSCFRMEKWNRNVIMNCRGCYSGGDGGGGVDGLGNGHTRLQDTKLMKTPRRGHFHLSSTLHLPFPSDSLWKSSRGRIIKYTKKT